jgi:hypothetical protein
LHRGHDIKSVEGSPKQFYGEWSEGPVEKFEGLSIEDFLEFKTRFQINMVEVYSLQEGFARSIYKSEGQLYSTMYVNLYENTHSYIRDSKIYT